MQYVAWDARLSAPVETGGTVRSNLELAAAAGNAPARAELVGPPAPYALEHLHRWHAELTRGLGEGLNGRAPLTWTALDAWARWTGATPYAHEIEALFALDAIARHPDAYPDLVFVADEDRAEGMA